MIALKTKNGAVAHRCELCGAIISDEVIQSRTKRNLNYNCPICHEYGEELVPYNHAKLVSIYDALTSIQFREFKVDAVFIDYNGVGNPRIVVRFADNYFNDWNSLVYPKGFKLTCIRPERHFPRPVEFLYTMDLSSSPGYGSLCSEIDLITEELLRWIGRFPESRS